MNHICTWLCADEKGEESLFPQTGQLSSSRSHQEIYWRCVILFFITSRRFNKNEHHILFTNVKQLPVVDGRSVSEVLSELRVSVVYTGFSYKTPKGYYGSFQNQFYEFSILEEISTNNDALKDQYLIVDSDCIFIKPAQPIFDAAGEKGFLSYRDNVSPDYNINGLSRNDMKQVAEELLDRQLDSIPDYHYGEFFLASVANIKKIYSDFTRLWPVLLQRHAAGQMKFNEEAHTLSYLYMINGLEAEQRNIRMKRVWTNPLFYRNVELSDTGLNLWHLPAEKTFGLKSLYDELIHEPDFGGQLTDERFVDLAQRILGIPHLSLAMRMRYYTVSYYRAIKKRLPWKKAPATKINVKTSVA